MNKIFYFKMRKTPKRGLLLLLFFFRLNYQTPIVRVVLIPDNFVMALNVPPLSSFSRSLRYGVPSCKVTSSNKLIYQIFILHQDEKNLKYWTLS